MFFKSPRRYFLFSPLVLLIGFLVIYYLPTIRKDCRKINCFKMEDLGKFKLKEVYEEDRNIYRALFAQEDDLLRIEVKSQVGEKEAGKYIEAEIVRMKALFQNAASPYPGELSSEISCSEEFKPVLKTVQQNNLQISYFTGFLNTRLTFGACTQNQAIYKSILVLFYCPLAKQLFQVEIIAPKEKFTAYPKRYQKMLDSISCGF